MLRHSRTVLHRLAFDFSRLPPMLLDAALVFSQQGSCANPAILLLQFKLQ